jgi:hypothetical protein
VGKNQGSHRSLTAVVAAFMIWGTPVASCQSSHSAAIVLTHDALATPLYAGTSNPTGSFEINPIGGNPGYLNGISGGAMGTATGQVGTHPVQPGVIELVAVAIHVTDSAGPSHSLSSLNDQALADMVNDLNNSTSHGDSTITAYAYGAAPTGYANAEAALSAGEVANSGQPFDILLTAIPLVGSVAYWSLDLHNEVGNLDGITALTVTDIGAVPEPRAWTFLTVGLVGIVLARRRRREPLA